MRSQFRIQLVCLSVAAGVAGAWSGNAWAATVLSANSGTITIPTCEFKANTVGGCFVGSQGWDKYFTIATNFCGPNVGPCTPCFENPLNQSNLVVQTCDPANSNGVLRTGIVLQRSDLPTDKVCATNSVTCVYGTNLTIAARAMASGKKYRATIFYKSNTLAGLTNIVVQWRYE